MALTVNTNIINDTDNYTADAKQIKGGYGVVSAYTDLANLPTATIVNGSLYYCSGDSKFYQYNGTEWQEKKFSEDNQTVQGNGTSFAAGDVVNIVGSGATTVTGNATAKTITITSTDTDTKVTAVGNHYTPSGGTALTPSSSGTASRGSTVVMTGVTKDAAGHITGVTGYTLPASDNTNQTIKGNGSAFGSNDAVDIVGSGSVTVTPDTTNKKITISSTGEENVQSDWNITDTSSDAYIKNKPTIPTSVSVTDASVTSASTVVTSLSSNGMGVKVNKLPISTALNNTTTAEQSKLPTAGAVANYIAARGENLLTNGNFLLNSNYNFPSTFGTFTTDDAYYCGGCMQRTGQATAFTSEYMAVDPSQTYEFNYWIKCSDADVAHFDIIDMYDMDKFQIVANYIYYISGSTTYLTQDLAPGDTVVHVASTSGFIARSNGYQRGLIIWDYKNSKGYQYGTEEYSRYTYTRPGTWGSTTITESQFTLGKNVGNFVCRDWFTRTGSGTTEDPYVYTQATTWTSASTTYYYFNHVSGTDTGLWTATDRSPFDDTAKTITLSQAWQGRTVPAGTYLSQSSSGGTYKYLNSGFYVTTANTWENKKGTIGGIGKNDAAGKFRGGTAFVKVGYLINYSNRSSTKGDRTTSVVKLSNLSFGIKIPKAITDLTDVNHSSSSTTYGVGSTSAYGHNKIITGDVKDKSYVDGEAAAAAHTHSNYVNQNAFSNIKVGSTTIAADTTTDTVELVAGSNITLTPNADTDTITITATDTTYDLSKYVQNNSTGTDNGIVRFDGTTGKLVQDSTGNTIDDSGNLTTKGILKVQNGSAAGCMVIGADVSATTLTNGTRTLGRMGFPTQANKSLICSFASLDTNNGNGVEFGGREGDSTTTSPDYISFTTATTANSTTAKTLVAQYLPTKVQFFPGGGTNQNPDTSLTGKWEFNNDNTFKNNTYTYTLPNKTGTIALASDITDTNQTIAAKVSSSSTVTFGASDQVTLVPGSSVTLAASASDKTITINATDTNTAHAHTAGIGLVGSGSSGTSGTYTYKADLASETKDANAALTRPTSDANRIYPVIPDKNGDLAVIVPWTSGTGYTGGVGIDVSGTTIKAKLHDESAQTTGSSTYWVGQDDENGSLMVNVPWTDHITTATTSGSGNAVTSISANASGALTITKETTFLTSHQDISGKENTSNKETGDSLTDSTTYYPSSHTVKKEIQNIKDGINKNYSIDSESDITGTKGSTGTWTNVTAITGVTIANLKIGDNIYIKDLSVSDLWVSGLNKNASEVTTSVTLSVLETAKPKISDFQVDSESYISDTVAYLYTMNDNYDASDNKLATASDIPTVGKLNTNNTTAQTASSSESFSGTINLHKVAKTGTFGDLLSKPTTLSGYGITDSVITGSGTTNYIPKFTGAKTVGNWKAYTDIVPNTNVWRNNLGNPSLYEMAFADSEWVNKTQAILVSCLLFERSSDGTTWTEDTSLTTQQKLRVFIGDTDSNITIATGNYLRITVTSPGYCYLNAIYLYTTAGSNYLDTKWEVHQRWTTEEVDIWTTKVDFSSSNYISNWPGHSIMPIENVAWSTGNNSSYKDKVRLTIHAVGKTTTTSYSSILYKMQLWGGYPAGKRHLYSIDYAQNFTFPASVKAPSFVENGTALSSKYLGISANAASATKATQDASGNVLTTSYASSLVQDATSQSTFYLKSKSGATLSTITVPTPGTTYTAGEGLKLENNEFSLNLAGQQARTTDRNYDVTNDEDGLFVNVPWTDTDTKNTAGSTDTSSKIFLVGATSQAANPQTYSQDTVYAGSDGYIYSNSKKVYGGTVNSSVGVAGTTKSTYTFDVPALVAPNGIIMSGTAASAGLVTCGICGVTTPDTTGACSKDNLYINYDSTNTYSTSRQLILQAGSAGSVLTPSTADTSSYGYLYQYAAVRGDVVASYLKKYYPLATSVVTLTGDQTIAGTKHFTTNPTTQDTYTVVSGATSDGTVNLSTGLYKGVDYTTKLTSIWDLYFTESQSLGFAGGYDSGGQIGQRNGMWSCESGTSSISCVGSTNRATIKQVLDFSASTDVLYRLVNGSYVELCRRSMGAVGTYATNYPYPIFSACSSSGGNYNAGKACIYSVKFYDQDDTLLRDYVSVTSQGNACGMWDKVNSTFLTSSGLTAGSATSETIAHTGTLVSDSQLATVATTGKYTDLSNRPTIPTVNNGSLTIQRNGTTVSTFTANSASNVTANITVPTTTSALTNDSNFVTKDAEDLTHYYNTTQMAQKYVDQYISLGGLTAAYGTAQTGTDATILAKLSNINANLPIIFHNFYTKPQPEQDIDYTEFTFNTYFWYDGSTYKETIVINNYRNYQVTITGASGLSGGFSLVGLNFDQNSTTSYTIAVSDTSYNKQTSTITWSATDQTEHPYSGTVTATEIRGVNNKMIGTVTDISTGYNDATSGYTFKAICPIAGSTDTLVITLNTAKTQYTYQLVDSSATDKTRIDMCKFTFKTKVRSSTSALGAMLANQILAADKTKPIQIHDFRILKTSYTSNNTCEFTSVGDEGEGDSRIRTCYGTVNYNNIAYTLYIKVTKDTISEYNIVQSGNQNIPFSGFTFTTSLKTSTTLTNYENIITPLFNAKEVYRTLGGEHVSVPATLYGFKLISSSDTRNNSCLLQYSSDTVSTDTYYDEACKFTGTLVRANGSSNDAIYRLDIYAYRGEERSCYRVSGHDQTSHTYAKYAYAVGSSSSTTYVYTTTLVSTSGTTLYDASDNSVGTLVDVITGTTALTSTFTGNFGRVQYQATKKPYTSSIRLSSTSGTLTDEQYNLIWYHPETIIIAQKNSDIDDTDITYTFIGSNSSYIYYRGIPEISQDAVRRYYYDYKLQINTSSHQYVITSTVKYFMPLTTTPNLILASTSTSGQTTWTTKPTVNDPTITITQGGTTKGSFTLNQSTNQTIALDSGSGGTTLYRHKIDFEHDTGATFSFSFISSRSTSYDTAYAALTYIGATNLLYPVDMNFEYSGFGFSIGPNSSTSFYIYYIDTDVVSNIATLNYSDVTMTDTVSSL